MRFPAFVVASALIAAFAASKPALALTVTCPAAPGTFNNGQALAGGWQIAIEEMREARVEEWTNGIAFYLPAASGHAAITELQCIARARQDSDGTVVQVEARKPLDAHYRCTFSRQSRSFDCNR